MASYWSKACTAQYNRPHLQLANYGGSIFAVSEASTWHLGLLLCGAAAAAVLMLALNAAIAALGFGDALCRSFHLLLLRYTVARGACVG